MGFTKLDYVETESETPFDLIERSMCKILTRIGNFSTDAKLEPGETCEIPNEDKPTICLVFDEYRPEGKEFYIGDRKHGLLLIIEVFRVEMEYARTNGSARLLQKLTERGHYPYSDLDRDPVV